MRNGRSLANIKQLLHGEADSQEQGVDLEAVEQPAEVRGDEDPPLLSIEQAVPRYSADRVHLRHHSLLPVQKRARLRPSLIRSVRWSLPSVTKLRDLIDRPTEPVPDRAGNVSLGGISTHSE